MTRDAFDRLRDADPLRDRDLPQPDDPAARAMREAVMGGAVSSLDAARRRRRWIAAGAAAAAVAAAAAALAVTTARVEDPTVVGCYTAPSTQADTVVVGVGDDGPVGTCAALWAEGVMDPEVTGEGQVPVLVPCVLDEGQVGVFPTASCDDVTDDPVVRPDPGDPTATSPATEDPSSAPTTSEPPVEGLPMPDYGTDDERVRRALESIRLALLDRCLTLEAAIEVAEEALADEGLEGWTVGSVLEDHPDGTCAGFFPDAAERAVLFVPDEPEPGQTPTGPGG